MAAGLAHDTELTTPVGAVAAGIDAPALLLAVTCSRMVKPTSEGPGVKTDPVFPVRAVQLTERRSPMRPPVGARGRR